MEINNILQINPSQVQSILFLRSKWTPAKAKTWLKRYGFKHTEGYERTKNYYRFPQAPVENFDRFRTIEFSPEKGIKAIIGFKDTKSNPGIENSGQNFYTIYMNLYLKYLDEARKLVKKKDFVQAGEKYYGAVAELVKMIGEKLGMFHKGLRGRLRILEYLNKKEPEKRILTLYKAGPEALHHNFYENHMSKENFMDSVQNTEELISILENYLGLR